jgi:hypothetical protein
MAVDLKLYENSDGDPVKAFKVAGVDSIEILAEISITNGDGAGSIYRIAKIPANYVPIWGEINCEALTSMNDNDLGLYETDEQGGAVIDKDILVNGADHSSALAIGSGTNALKDLGTTNLGKTLAQLAGDGISERQAYTLALTANAGPTATGKIYLRMRFINAA